MHFHQALVDATLDNAFGKRPTQESRKDSQDVDAHGSKVRGNFAAIMREKKDYKSVVSHPYQVFNGIFLTLPLDGIRQTGLRVPLLQEACEMGLERGRHPHEILEEFLEGKASMTPKKARRCCSASSNTSNAKWCSSMPLRMRATRN